MDANLVAYTVKSELNNIKQFKTKCISNDSIIQAKYRV